MKKLKQNLLSTLLISSLLLLGSCASNREDDSPPESYYTEAVVLGKKETVDKDGIPNYWITIDVYDNLIQVSPGDYYRLKENQRIEIHVKNYLRYSEIK
ncbi:hypothetical protein EBU94_04465 [bacterium]|nr:hypothetical protein [bacterium]